MTHHVTILVKSTDARYIAVCDDGTLALVWHRAVIHLRSDELARVLQVLERWANDLDSTWTSDDVVTLIRDPAGAVQLWLGDVGLYLAGYNLLALTDLIHVAILRLHDAETLNSTAARSCTEAFCPLRLPPDGSRWNN